MTRSDYYNILGIPVNSSVEEIKKAYRRKARLYHPDINHSPDAKDLFIRLTEAYDFLIVNHEKIISDEEYAKVMEDWRKYRQDRSQQRAKYYAQASYNRFKNTKFYKSTEVYNGPAIIFNFIISIMVLVATIVGYISKIRHPVADPEFNPLFSFILLLGFSIILLTFSVIYLIAYIETSKKQRKGKY